MATFSAIRGWTGLWHTATIFAVGLVWPWPIAAAFGLDHYTMTMAFFLSGWTTVALLVGLVWGLIAQRVVAGTIAVAAVAIIPPFAGSAYVLERQRIPNAPCATEVEFHIGKLQLAVPRDLGVYSVVSDGAPAQVWEGRYGEQPSAKPDVRALCSVTDNGRSPVDVAYLLVSFNWFKRELEKACESGTGVSQPSAGCTAQTRTTPTVVQFYARPDGMPSPSRSYFDAGLVNDARAKGELDGYRCKDSKIGPSTRYCTVWYQLSPEVLVVSSAKLGPEQKNEDPLADTIVLLDALIQRLDPL